MSLPLPNLDNKTFAVLVDEAAKLIPRHAPQWTDHNQHDPGITFIELFAWLAEMQGYYLNQIGEAQERKYLKLLGASPDPATLARAAVVFSLKSSNIGLQMLPAGTKLKVKDAGTIFETESPLPLAPATLKAVIGTTKDGSVDFTEANQTPGINFNAFGAEAEAGNRLYLGFAGEPPFPVGKPVALSFDLFEGYPVARGSHGNEAPQIEPSALIRWEYLKDETVRNEKEQFAWTPLNLNAELQVIMEDEISRLPESEPLCPKLRRRLAQMICETAAFAKLHGKTISDQEKSALAQAKNYLEKALAQARTVRDLRRLLTNPELLRLQGDETLMLSQSGRLTFIAPDKMKRRSLAAITGGAQSSNRPNAELYWLRATVQRAGYELPPRVDSIQLNTVPAVQRETLSQQFLFSSNGEQDQTIHADSFLALTGMLVVQVRERDGSWLDWIKSPLSSSNPTDPHYEAKMQTTEPSVAISFGDNAHGRIPPAGQNNIRLICCSPLFADARLIGQSNGLPRQFFQADQFPVIAETFALQVEEPFAETARTEETREIGCVLRFTRRTPARVPPDKTIPVELVIEAKRSLWNVCISEFAAGNPEKIYYTQQLNGLTEAGSAVKLSYKVEADRRGKNISGEIRFQLSPCCGPEAEFTPVSIIETGDLPRATRWRDWVRVDDFDASQPGDRHFTLDAETGKITFGDGISGSIPPAAAEKNIRIISYQTGGGVSGNVSAEKITQLDLSDVVRSTEAGELAGKLEQLGATNPAAAKGGEAAETVEEAQTRARRDLKTHYQGVTSEDLEELARQTPGLRVAKARAIPLFEPGVNDYPAQTTPASVTVVVLPFSFFPNPNPSEAFLRTVCRHLDRHRLLTTRLHVVGPDYARVSVQASVLPLAGFDPTALRQEVEKRLGNFLRPLPAEDDPQGKGWPFGRAVYRSEIYQLIESIAGVDCVEDVALLATGQGVRRDADGNVPIPPQCLVYSGEHQIDILSPQAECRAKSGAKGGTR